MRPYRLQTAALKQAQSSCWRSPRTRSLGILVVIASLSTVACGHIGIDLSGDNHAPLDEILEDDNTDGDKSSLSEDKGSGGGTGGEDSSGSGAGDGGGTETGVGGTDSSRGDTVTGGGNAVGGTSQTGGIAGDDTDGGGDTDTTPACVEEKFSKPERLTGLNKDRSDMWGPSATGDGLTLFFSALSPGASSEVIYRSTRPDKESAFGAAQAVKALNGAASEGTPFISYVGTRIYYSLQNGTNRSSRNIYFAELDEDSGEFGDATEMEELNSARRDHLPWLSKDELSVFFASERDNSDSSIWTASRGSIDEAFGSPSKVPGLDSESDSATSPSLSADGLIIYFSTKASSGTGNDFWSATREGTDAEFSNATRIDALSSEGDDDLDLRRSADGSEVFFSSNRSGGTYQLWSASRTCLSE